MVLRFTVLASGSRGNASLVHTDRSSVLLDVGLGPRELRKRLAQVGASWPQVEAVLLTHTHSDHWNERTLAHLRRQRIPLWCHPTHHAALLGAGQEFAGLVADGLVRAYEVQQDWPVAEGLQCRALPLRHDGGSTFGFRFETTVGLFATPAALAYAADLGSWTAELAQALADVDVLAVEFNHDVAMQHASGRSPLLIRRVLSEHGHLSNDQAAALVEHVLALSAPDRLRHVVQLHLSRDCNRPALAVAAAGRAIGERAIQVHTARQDRPGPALSIGVVTGGNGKPRAGGSRRGRTANHPCLPGLEP